MTLSNNGNHSGSSTLLNQMSDLDFRRGIARDRSRGPTPPPPPPGYPHSSSSSSYRPQPPPPQQQNQQFVASGSSSQMAQRHTPYQSQSHHSQGFRGPPQRSSLHPPPRRHHDASSSFSSSSPSPYSPRRMDSVSLEDVISHACVDILQEAGQHSLKAVELANTLRARVGTEPLGRVRELWGGLLALLEMHPRLFKVERIPKNDVVSLAIPGGESSQQVDLPARNPSSQHGEEVKTEEPSSSSSSSLSQGESNNNNTASSRCLHVSSLLPTIVEADIMNAFGVFGDIEDITMVSQRSRRFTFVRFKRMEDAIHAKEQLSGSYPWLNCISFAHHEEPNANILSLPTSSSSPSSSSNIASLSPSKHTHTPIQRSYYAQQSRPQQSFQETSSAPWSKQPLQQEEYGSSQLRFSKSVLSVLTDDTYVPTQSWQCSPTSDAPFIQAVITQLQILGGVATISKLRGLLKSRIQSVVNIKSVPLKALLAAYPRYFTLTSNLAELKPEFMASQPNNAMYHHPLANIRGGSF